MLTEEEVRKIALLSRIGLKEEEIPRYQKDLSAVFDFFRELETLPTDEVAPIGHITGRTDVMRTDAHEDFGRDEKALIMKNAPDTKDNFLKVRSVF
ncbi:MAG: Asp-tRNA(Asn)/Glu-tRNA(Gln) amidotransferase subunit GatC [Candidatus Moranbacteria bacterium]|nr:Asp-tRNA(Asn)/Glu-tRNA(Gln) amidotransferase subunit GatC [Candidatus Moranbacteria bacterium]